MMDNVDYGKILRNRYTDVSLSSTILIILGTVIGLFGNGIIIVFYFFRIKERGERYFIPLLAIVDFLACFTSSLFYIMDNTYFFNYPSDIICRILTFSQTFVPGISAHILVIICVQRYILVCKPFVPKMTLFWKRMSFAFVSLFALLYSLPLLGISGLKTSNENFMNHTVEVTICKFSAVETSSKITAYFGFLALLMIFNIVITVALYIPVLKRIQISFSVKKLNSIPVTTLESNISQATNARKLTSKEESISISMKSCTTESNTESNIHVTQSQNEKDIRKSSCRIDGIDIKDPEGCITDFDSKYTDDFPITLEHKMKHKNNLNNIAQPIEVLERISTSEMNRGESKQRYNTDSFNIRRASVKRRINIIPSFSEQTSVELQEVL
ncbi:unnamed protein product [Mytilus coruscus]|uniref:G-protein coupled receptors family 1 profile domain-containing protein n=1 Tax=Mytilus coruscus TaxID=42192 RepID=A0A6J8DLG7_MYTCO|nr:unnamed protein product [Mytilus coruscus]